MSVARRPVAAIEQVEGLQGALGDAATPTAPSAFITAVDAANAAWDANTTTDTADFVRGGASIKMTVGPSTVSSSKSVSLDLSGLAYLGFWVKIPDVANLVEMNVQLLSAGKQIRAAFPGPYTSDGARAYGDWVYLTVAAGNLGLYGGATLDDLASIDTIRWAGKSAAGTTVTAWLNDIHAVKRQSIGCMTWTFDDGLENNYTIAAPALEAAGVRGTFYVVTGLIGTSGYMTAAQLQDLAARGHDICAHSVNHTQYHTMTLADVEADMKQARDTLLGLGVGRSAIHMAFPGGSWWNLPEWREVYRRYARTVRIGAGAPANPLPDMHPYGILRSQAVSSATSAATINAWADIAAGGVWQVLYCHGVVASGASGLDTNAQTIIDATAYARSKGVAVLSLTQVIDGMNSCLRLPTVHSSDGVYVLDNIAGIITPRKVL